MDVTKITGRYSSLSLSLSLSLSPLVCHGGMQREQTILPLILKLCRKWTPSGHPQAPTALPTGKISSPSISYKTVGVSVSV